VCGGRLNGFDSLHHESCSLNLEIEIEKLQLKEQQKRAL
jgi:hypothetical protein